MKLVSNKPELTFDDVLLLPSKSDFVIEDDFKFTDLKTRVSKNITIDIPVTSSPMPGVTEIDMAVTLGKMGGMGFLHHFQGKVEQLRQLVKIKKHKVKVAVSIPDLSKEGIKHVGKLIKAGADLICVETGHAHNVQTLKFIKKLKTTFNNIEVCAALVVTPEATKELIKAGADSIRVGIGGGSHCTTRLVTGIGRPQLTAIRECHRVAKKYNVPIISDTGIKYPGDIAKALVFGAESVMIGGLFAGTKECPGDIVKKQGRYFKHSWGMCAEYTIDDRNNIKKTINFIKQYKIRGTIKHVLKRFMLNEPQTIDIKFQEGIGKLVPYKGSVVGSINELIAGLTRSMWYLGAHNVSELMKKAQVITVTPNTQLDNLPSI